MNTDTTISQVEAADGTSTVHESDVAQVHLTQSGAPVQVQLPQGENVVRVQVTPGETIQLPFPSAGLVARLGDNGNLAVKVGDITVILLGYTEALGQGEVNMIGNDGKAVDVAAVLAATDPNLDIQTAAGPGAGDQGAGADNNGGLFAPFDPNDGIGGLNAIGGLNPTEKQYNLINREFIDIEQDDPIVVVSDSGIVITTTGIAINEDDLSSEGGFSGPSDFVHNEESELVAPSNCDLPAQYDGNDEFDGGDSDNPVGMPDFWKEQTDVIASIDVDYGANLPSDPAAAFDLIAPGNVPTSNGEVLTLTLSPDGHTILATRPSDGVPIFEIHLVNVTVNGSVVTYEVEFCLINRIDHPAAGESPENQDTWPITVNFEVTDSIGGSGTSHFDVTVKDDVPFIGYPYEGESLSIQVDGGELCVHEANFDGPLSLYGSFGPLNYGADGAWGAGEAGQFEGDNAGESPATLSLQIVDPDGAVGGNGDPAVVAALTFDANGNQVGTSSLKAGGETVLFKQLYDAGSDTLTVIGYLDDGVDNGNDWENSGNLVLQIIVNVDDANVDWQSGQYQVQVFQPLDHPDGNETGSSDEFVFNLGLTIKDDDGDTATAEASFCVTDDGPSVYVDGATVTHDETAGEQDDDVAAGLVPALIAGIFDDYGTPLGAAQSAPGNISYSFGADGAGEVRLTDGSGADLNGAASGIFRLSDGAEVMLYTDASNPNLVLGKVGTDVVLAIYLDTTDNTLWVAQYEPIKHDLASADDDRDSTLNAIHLTVIDSDGDAVTSSEPLQVQIDDDGPDANDDTDTIDEGTVTASGNVMTGADTDGGLGGSGADTEGTDGASVTEVTGANSGGPKAADGSVHILGQYGYLVMAADGTYTYTLTETNAPGDAKDVFTYKLVDGDGDSDTATLTIPVDGAGGTISAEGCVAEDLQPEQWSGDTSVSKEALTISFDNDDNETITGASITVPSDWQLEIFDTSGGGSLVVTLNEGVNDLFAILQAAFSLSDADTTTLLNNLFTGASTLELRPIPPENTDVDGSFSVSLDLNDPDSDLNHTVTQPITVFVDAVADKPTNVTISVTDQNDDSQWGVPASGNKTNPETGNIHVTGHFNDLDGSETHTATIELPDTRFSYTGPTGANVGGAAWAGLEEVESISYVNGVVTVTFKDDAADASIDLPILYTPTTNREDPGQFSDFEFTVTVSANETNLSGGGCGPDDSDADPTDPDGSLDNQASTTASVTQPNILNGDLRTNTPSAQNGDQAMLLTFLSATDPLSAYSQVVVRDTQGQQGAVLADAGFNIDPTSGYNVALENPLEGHKVIVTDFSLEGVVIEANSGNIQIEHEDASNKPMAVLAQITPSTDTTVSATDSLDGDGGNNVNGGTSGHDYLYGGSGNDSLSGNGGDDFLNGGIGNDTLSGGTGDDLLVWNGGLQTGIGNLALDDTYDGGADFDILRVDQGALFNSTVSNKGSIDYYPDLAADATVNLHGAHVSNIEAILITEEAVVTSPTSQSGDPVLGTKIVLDASDVLAFSGSNDHSLYVIGSSGDKVDIDGTFTNGAPDGGNIWTQQADYLHTNGVTFAHYTATVSGQTVNLYVDQDVTVV